MQTKPINKTIKQSSHSCHLLVDSARKTRNVPEGRVGSRVYGSRFRSPADRWSIFTLLGCPAGSGRNDRYTPEV